jgi:hypothetical protein
MTSASGSCLSFEMSGCSRTLGNFLRRTAVACLSFSQSNSHEYPARLRPSSNPPIPANSPTHRRWRPFVFNIDLQQWRMMAYSRQLAESGSKLE